MIASEAQAFMFLRVIWWSLGPHNCCADLCGNASIYVIFKDFGVIWAR